MKTAISISRAIAGRLPAWRDSADAVVEAERLGVDFAWAGEAWIHDGATPLGYLAAVTSRIRLGTGIMVISARPPAVAAMTALSLSNLSGGRFALGLGTSGPQVVEGLHGVPFDEPLERLAEYTQIVKAALRGKKLQHAGRHYRLPAGSGKSLRLGLQAEGEIPIYFGSLSPRSLRLAGALADGVLYQVFVPERAEVFLDPLREGAREAGRDYEALDRQAGGIVEFGDDRDALIARHKMGVAFNLGGMGSAKQNFYTRAYMRAGWQEEARAVQRLWLDGEREAAAARVPDEMVLRTHLLGDDTQVLERIRAYRDAGITTLRLAPQGDDLAAQNDTLTRAMKLVAQVNAQNTSEATEGSRP